MDKTQKLNQALANILGDEILEWERQELSERLGLLNPRAVTAVLRALPVIWPVSYILFYAFVEQAEAAVSCLDAPQFSKWVRDILDVYEAKGVREAQLFMETVESRYVCAIRGEAGATLESCQPVLLSLAQALSGREITITTGSVVSFDSETITLPQSFNICRGHQDNFLLYKFSVIFQCALESQGTFQPLAESDSRGIEKGGDDILYILEALRAIITIRRRFKGVMADCATLFSEIKSLIPKASNKSYSTELVGLNHLLIDSAQGLSEQALAARFASLTGGGEVPASLNDSLLLRRKLLEEISKRGDSPKYLSTSLPPFMGRLDLSGAWARVEERREHLKERCLKALKTFIHAINAAKSANSQTPVDDSFPGTLSKEEISAMLIQAAANEDSERDSSTSLEITHLDLGEREIPTELVELSREARREFGAEFGQFISSTVGLAGSGLGSAQNLIEESATEDGSTSTGELLYDEWDLNRRGFRKQWCQVFVKEVEAAGGTFVVNTLKRYRGLLHNLRRQFEMMSVEERYMRRQRHGDDIDLDALQDSLADTKAGLPPSEHLFCRLIRDERNITTLFLVDMSSSTEGWINRSIKEALILMSEALNVLGDNYAIYGFSGMRRKRCEIFRVKEFNEVYGSEIRDKIAGISPKEYTRMGPAIRHASTILSENEAKVRLLIVLSDGKPEDYDNYKGRYAIEDTRHALIEAKSRGIHPFCITVDRKAHDYMSHLYGEVNYIFIDDIAKLPARMPEIYRNLTC